MRTPLLLYGLSVAIRVVPAWHFPRSGDADSIHDPEVAAALPSADLDP